MKEVISEAVLIIILLGSESKVVASVDFANLSACAAAETRINKYFAGSWNHNAQAFCLPGGTSLKVEKGENRALPIK